MILDWDWLSKSVPTQYHLKKKIILGIRALLAGCVRANHRHWGPAVTAGRLIWWVLIKITSDKFTSACLLGWKEGFSPKSTVMNWNLSATGKCFSPSLHFVSELRTSSCGFSFLLLMWFPNWRKGRADTGPCPSGCHSSRTHLRQASRLPRSFSSLIPTAPLWACPGPCCWKQRLLPHRTCKVIFLSFYSCQKCLMLTLLWILILVILWCMWRREKWSNKKALDEKLTKAPHSMIEMDQTEDLRESLSYPPSCSYLSPIPILPCSEAQNDILSYFSRDSV